MTETRKWRAGTQTLEMVFGSESLGYVTDYLKEMFNRWNIMRLGHILDIIFLPAVASLFGFWFGFLFICLFVFICVFN